MTHKRRVTCATSGTVRYMRTLRNTLLFVVLLAAAPSLVTASTIIDGWAVSIDGNLFTSFLFPSPVATTGDLMASGVLADGTQVRIGGTFDAGTIDMETGGWQLDGAMGLGQLEVTLFGSGTHTVSFWVDHHFDVGLGPIFYNEFALADDTVPDEYSYTIDEPGYGDPNGYQGTAYSQNASQTLDNTNHLGPDDPTNAPSDVSMAIAITHAIPTAGARWTFSFNYEGSDYTQPGFFLPTNFHLTQSSNDTISHLYFSADVRTVPEPGTLYLPGGAALLFLAARLRKRVNTR
jgi:hypothetical protein